MRHITMAVILLSISSFGFNAVASEQHKVQGVVKAIKTSDKKITVSHGPIASLGMPGMTMDFAVYDPAMLDEVSKGHKVSMMVEVDKDGKFIIMDLEDQGEAGKESMSMSGMDHEHMHSHK